MFEPEEAVRVGYLDYIIGVEDLDAAVQQEVQRLGKLDMKSYALTKARLNHPVLVAINKASPQL
jgi:hypothetical protein